MTCVASFLRSPSVTPVEFPDFPSLNTAIAAVESGYFSGSKKNDLWLFRVGGTIQAYALALSSQKFAVFRSELRSPDYLETRITGHSHGKLIEYGDAWNTFYSSSDNLLDWLKIFFRLEMPLVRLNVILLSIIRDAKIGIPEDLAKLCARRLAWCAHPTSPSPAMAFKIGREKGRLLTEANILAEGTRGSDYIKLCSAFCKINEDPDFFEGYFRLVRQAYYLCSSAKRSWPALEASMIDDIREQVSLLDILSMIHEQNIRLSS